VAALPQSVIRLHFASGLEVLGACRSCQPGSEPEQLVRTLRAAPLGDGSPRHPPCAPELQPRHSRKFQPLRRFLTAPEHHQAIREVTSRQRKDSIETDRIDAGGLGRQTASLQRISLLQRIQQTMLKGDEALKFPVQSTPNVHKDSP
jgi:hypothetical protein